MAAMCSEISPTIAIIGGGFSGSLVAVHLLRSATFPIIVKLIERASTPGQGVAYSTREDCHLLNVPAGKMSAFPDDPGHFFRWLETHYGRQFKADSFVPRKLYGAYIQTILQEAELKAPPALYLERIHDEAIAILPDENGARIRLQNGTTLSADRIILAVGNFPPGDPLVEDSSFYQSQRYSGDPWSPAVFKALDPLDTVLLIGSGLTTIDLVLGLKARGHQGAIHIISRHGLLPHRHQSSASYPPFLTIADVSKTLRVLLRRVRQEIDHAASQGYDWRAVIDALRPQTQVLWRALTETEQKRFLRHLRPYWEIHRHRIAPEVTDAISRLQQSRQLLVHAGCIQSYKEQNEVIKVTYRPRHHHEFHTLQVNRVINCTGPECNYRKLRHPLISNLLKAGLIWPDPLALGLDVNSNGALVSATDIASRRLYTLGPPRKGCLWETTAVPEIREQAQALAQHLLHSLGLKAAVLSKTVGIV